MLSLCFFALVLDLVLCCGLWLLLIASLIDPFHIVSSLSNRSSIEKMIKLFLKMKGQIAYLLHCKTHSDAL